ncbi:MAG: hypothetical protein ACOX2F_11335 [bacterium]
MTQCPHCEFEGNNFFYCAGCGREIQIEKQQVFSKLPENSTKFLSEAVKTIEEVFCANSDIEATLDMDTQIISMSEISKESGIFIVDNAQWEEAEGNVKLNCFFGETALSYAFSIALTLISVFAGLTGTEMIFKLFFTCYILASFLQWFVFPFFAGTTVAAFAGYGCGLFIEQKSSVKGHSVLLLTLTLFMSLYSLFPFFFLEYFLASKIKNYVPVALKITGVDYLKKIGGNK